MNKWLESWKQLLPYEKVFRAMSLCLSIVVVTFWVLYVLQMLGVINAKFSLFAVGFFVMGFESFSSAAYQWRENRSTAVVNICSCAFVLVCSIIYFLYDINRL